MNMRRLLLNLFLATSLCLGGVSFAHAQDVNAVVIEGIGNKSTSFLFTDHPAVMANADSIVVRSSKVEMHFYCADVRNIKYKKVAGEGIANTNMDVTYRQVGESLVFSGQTGNTIRIYSIDGKLMPMKMAKTAEGLALPLNELASGAYIINVNGKSFKFIKR